jgi:uncharacterized protein (TIGR00304 family)
VFDWTSINALGFILVIAGFVMVFLASILFVLKSTKTKADAKGGGVVIVGPVPIVFGTDKESVKTLLILAILLIASLIIFMLLTYNR